MYSDWFGKRLVLEYSRPLVVNPEPDPEAVSEFLTRQGYREIAVGEDGVAAVRGSKAWNLINVGDARRLYHSTDVTLAPGGFSVRTEIDTWFGLGTQHDAAVFEAEVEMLGRLLETGVADDGVLQEAQARRRRSDLLTCGIFLGIGILVGAAMLVAILVYLITSG